MHISMIYHFSFIKCPYSTGEQHLLVLGIVHTFMHLVVLGIVHTFMHLVFLGKVHTFKK